MICFPSQGIDAGGSITQKDLAHKWELFNCVLNDEEYAYTTCALYGLDLILSLYNNLIMSDDDLLKRNALWCLQSAYNLAQRYNSMDWADLWMLITSGKRVGLKCIALS